MSTAQQRELISVEDYLAGELVSHVKHEYLGGYVYAMAGAKVVHNVITGNIFASLHVRLRGQKFRPYNSDMKIRVSLPMQTGSTTRTSRSFTSQLPGLLLPGRPGHTGRSSFGSHPSD